MVVADSSAVVMKALFALANDAAYSCASCRGETSLLNERSDPFVTISVAPEFDQIHDSEDGKKKPSDEEEDVLKKLLWIATSTGLPIFPS